jgi:hypothetical protein
MFWFGINFFNCNYPRKKNFRKQRLKQNFNYVSGVHLNKDSVGESLVNAPRITDHGSAALNLTSLFALFVFLLCRLTRGTFTIDFEDTFK